MPKIIGYIHICQKPGWERAFEMLYKSLMESGLYEATDEIRLGVLTDDEIITHHAFSMDKFKIVYTGKTVEYERPTLLHMRSQSESESCYYWYLHSKGLRHFGTSTEQPVLDWINCMLYWNVNKWRNAVKILDDYDTYGILLNGVPHYSGNFWWARSQHVKRLDTHIPSYYTAPEDYICTKKPKMFNAYSVVPFQWYKTLIPASSYNTLEVVEPKRSFPTVAVRRKVFGLGLR